VIQTDYEAVLWQSGLKMESLGFFLAHEFLVESDARFDLEDGGVICAVECVKFQLSDDGAPSAVGLSVGVGIVKRSVFACDLVLQSNAVIEVDPLSLMPVHALHLPVDLLVQVVATHPVHHRQQLSR
jgi:hypothetical protein